MKVAILAAGTETTLGGETRVACELAESLSKNVETAFVFTGSKNRIYRDGSLIKVSLKGGEHDYIKDEVPVYSTKTIKFFFDFLDEFKPDIIHSHSVWAAPFLGQVWSIMNNVPYIYTTHMMPSRLATFFELDEEKLMSKILNDKIFKGYYLEFINNCSAVIALNQVSKEDIHNYGYNGKSYIIPNGRYLEKFSDLKIPDINSKEKNLIFVGTITARKNQEFLLRIMKYLPKNYRLTLVGRFFFADYEKQFRKLATKYGTVDVVGGVEPSRVPQYLEGAHLFVSASKVEVQALSIIEALAAGKPVVGLSNETVDELVDSSVGAWLPKTATPKEFARAVESVLDKDKAGYEKLTGNAREKVESLDWSNIADRTIDVYKMIIDDHTRLGEKYVRNVSKILNLVPDFLGKSYIIDQVNNWNDLMGGKKKKERSLATVPGKTLVLAGLTVGVVAVAYQALKVMKAVRKKKKAK